MSEEVKTYTHRKRNTKKAAKTEDIKEELTPIYKNVKPLSERPKGIHTSDKKEEPTPQLDGFVIAKQPKSINETSDAGPFTSL